MNEAAKNNRFLAPRLTSQALSLSFIDDRSPEETAKESHGVMCSPNLAFLLFPGFPFDFLLSAIRSAFAFEPSNKTVLVDGFRPLL